MLRIGLGRLLSASIGPRWLMICDHTATYGGLKMLVVVGVDLALLEQRVADGTGDFSIDHRDLQPLAVVPMKHSSGELLLEIFMQCIGKHGNPERMVTDGGSDIMKSARLLAECQKSRGEEPTKHTYDISHRIARIVEGELATSAEWNKLEEFVTKARVYCKYRARHLSPPSLRHGPDRWMNLTGIVGWMSRLKDRITSSVRDAPGQLATHLDSYRQSPRFGFPERIWEAAKKAYNKRDGVFNALKRMCGKEYPSQQAYEKDLSERCPALPGEVKDRLDANNDLNRTYLEDVSAGSEPCWAIHREVVGMLAFSNAIQKHLKTAGLSKAGLETCRKIHEQSDLTGAGERIGREIMAVLEDMAKDLGDDERIVVTSDVIESLNGRWKMLINGAAMPALGVNALLMPALMGDLSQRDVKEALEAVSMADVENWKKKTFGLTFFQEQRSPVRKPRPENLREAIP
jgi:hypothetical protein